MCLALVVSCYKVPQPDCGFICGAGGSCPDNYTCGSDTICHRNGAPAGTVCAGDAGTLDMPFLSPMIVSTVPSDGATGVSRTDPISAVANQSLQDLTVNNDTFLVLAGSGVELPGVVAYDDGSLTLAFTPDGELPAGVPITVMLTANILATTSA